MLARNCNERGSPDATLPSRSPRNAHRCRIFGLTRIELGSRVLRLEGGTSGWVTNRSDVLLVEGDRLLARYEPVPWGDGRQRIAVDDRAAVQDGLLILLASNAAGYWSARAGMSGAAGGISQ